MKKKICLLVRVRVALYNEKMKKKIKIPEKEKHDLLF